MSWHHRLWNVLRPSPKQRELERELAFHLAERADDLESAGLTPSEARRLARRQFGNYTAQVERTRDMDINAAVESLLRNLRLAVRGLLKTPAFSITVVLTLALGIGANSAVFSAINAVLLRPLPFPHADRLVKLGQVKAKAPGMFVAPVRLEDWNRLNTTFTAISGYYVQDDSELSGELPEKLRHAFVPGRFLEVWGVAPALGRDFTPQEMHYGGPEAVIVSDRLWRRRFGADPNVVGKRLRLGRNSSVPIVGVMPASFLFADREVDLWSPSPADAPFAQHRDLTWYNGIGRLKPNVTLEQARADLSTVQSNLGRQFPKPDSEIRVVIEPLKETTIGGVRRSLWIVFGSVSLLLLIACTNIAALLLSRAAGRQHEIAVRFSLGASRLSVASQLMTEVLVLALAGASLGLLLAAASSRAFQVLAKDLPRVDEIGLDWRIVLYTLASALAATFLCGIFPAIRATRRSLASSMAQAGRSNAGGRNPVQFVLVGVQVALAVTLLAGAGLLLRSFQELGRVSPGFEPEHVLTLHISTSWAETNDRQATTKRMERILDALNAIPGVETAAATFSLPGVPDKYEVEVKPVEGRSETEPKMLAEERVVSPSYFAALQIPLMAGEMCRPHPGRPVMLVNRSFADRYLGGAAAVGRSLVEPANAYIQPSQIIGIVGDAREMGLDREPAPTIYWCSQMSQPGTYYLVRTHGAPKALAETVRRTIRAVEPLRSVYDITPLSDRISDAYAENRLRTVLLTFFASTAVSLACVGLYGTLSYLVNVRRREVGLRLALGALRSRIVRQFLAQGLRVSLLGCAAGIGLAALSVRLLAGMLYGVSPSDPVTLAAVIVTVVAVSAIASLLPAVRAARLEPMRVLRDE
jgi:predicted permease